jgi:hypothetical protein
MRKLCESHRVEVNGEEVNVSYDEGSMVSWIAESIVEKLGFVVKSIGGHKFVSSFSFQNNSLE